MNEWNGKLDHKKLTEISAHIEIWVVSRRRVAVIGKCHNQQSFCRDVSMKNGNMVQNLLLQTYLLLSRCEKMDITPSAACPYEEVVVEGL